MKRIFYSGGAVLTGDDIAEAVLAYAAALAKSPLAAVVHIPVVQENTGEHASASILIGPASQLMAVPITESGFDEPLDIDLVDDLQRKALRIGAPRPVAQTANDAVGHDDYE
jgi:hypothetical protein